MLLKNFDYILPEKLIASKPASPRDSAKLLLLSRQSKMIQHHSFYELADLLPENSVLVLNNSKVFPARIFGKKETGGSVECLLLKFFPGDTWESISSPGLKLGQKIQFTSQLFAKVIEEKNDGIILLEFSKSEMPLLLELQQIGNTPLPPYIYSQFSEDDLREKYQTIYAEIPGSAAAPTAGLHFTQEVFDHLAQKKIQIEYVRLHVGLGTFKKITDKAVQSKKLHFEDYAIKPDVANRINQAKKDGRKIIAVGTTTTRVLESNTKNGILTSGIGETDIFIQPGYKFQLIDGLITNFHLPQSSLLMLVSAFVSKPNTNEQFSDFSKSMIGKAYHEAIKHNYRFFSFGDAMLVL